MKLNNEKFVKIEERKAAVERSARTSPAIESEDLWRGPSGPTL